jgi:hypothetical protein
VHILKRHLLHAFNNSNILLIFDTTSLFLDYLLPLYLLRALGPLHSTSSKGVVEHVFLWWTITAADDLWLQHQHLPCRGPTSLGFAHRGLKLLVIRGSGPMVLLTLLGRVRSRGVVVGTGT